jgi:hypothetical protein
MRVTGTRAISSDIGAWTIMFTELYCRLAIALTFFRHIGFCLYEFGVAPTKNIMHALKKSAMVCLVRCVI